MQTICGHSQVTGLRTDPLSQRDWMQLAAGERFGVEVAKGGQWHVEPGASSSSQTTAAQKTIWHSQPSSDSGKTACPSGQTTSGQAGGPTARVARRSEYHRLAGVEYLRGARKFT